MSLDTVVSRIEDYFRFTAEYLAAFREADINLGEWVCDEEQISLRGGLYSDLMAQITGWSLWAAWTPHRKGCRKWLRL